MKFAVAVAATALMGVQVAQAQDMFPGAGPWTGAYIGAQADLLATKSLYDADNLPFTGPTLLGDMGGGGGIFGGFDYQFSDQFVAGIAAEANLDSTQLLYNGVDYGDAKWDAAIKGRLGYLVTPTVLTYGSIGYSWGHFDYTNRYPSPTYGNNDATVGGVQFGIGVDAMLASNIMGQLEATYTHYGSTTITQGGTPYQTTTPSLIAVKAGLAFKF